MEDMELFEALFLYTTDCILFTNKNGEIVNANPGSERLLGYNKHELIGRNVSGFFSEEIIKIYPSLNCVDFNSNSEKGLNTLTDLIVKRKNGTDFPAEIRLNPYSKDNEFHAFLFIVDITDRKRAEEQLETVNKELEAFTYSVTHDLSAPLRAVIGYSQMLSEGYGTQFDAEGKRILQNIKNNARKLGNLIDGLLTFSRLGRKEVQKREINLNEMMEDVIDQLNKTTNHNMVIKVDAMHKVKADYELLFLASSILVANGIKYTSKKNSPQLDIFSEERNGEIIVSVKDNGAGFDMKYANKLFGVFQRLHSQDEFEGTGVGLAMVQRIIAKHDGKVWAEGKINEGAVFYFSLTNN